MRSWDITIGDRWIEGNLFKQFAETEEAIKNFINVKDIYTEEYLRNLGLNERQIKAVAYAKENGQITNKEYQKINNCSRNTASADLKELAKRKIVEESGKRGAGSFYTIAH